MRLSNENILKMIFSSTHTLFEIKQKLNIFNNTILYKTIISLTAYNQIYKSLGRMKNISSECYCKYILPYSISKPQYNNINL
jgi:hypothetical protein